MIHENDQFRIWITNVYYNHYETMNSIMWREVMDMFTTVKETMEF